MVEALTEPGGQDVVVPESGGSRSSTPTSDYNATTKPQITAMEDLTPLREFYAGQHIFITGGTGFLGKLLIDKLLRRCPGLGFIYLLVRPKKGKDVHQRAEELFDDPVSTDFGDGWAKDLLGCGYLFWIV